MRRKEEPYSREIWLVTGINIPINTLLVAKYFAVTVEHFQEKAMEQQQCIKESCMAVIQKLYTAISKGYKVFFVGRTMCY